MTEPEMVAMPRGGQKPLEPKGLAGRLGSGVGRRKFLFQAPHFPEQLESPLGLLLIDFGEGKTDVHQDVVAYGGLGHEIEPALANSAAKLHTPGARKAQVLAT